MAGPIDGNAVFEWRECGVQEPAVDRGLQPELARSKRFLFELMSFHAANNRITLTNRSGETIFDTERKMPVIVGSLSGSVHFAGLGDFPSVVNVALGPCDPRVDFVYPTLLIASSSSSQYANGGIPFSSPGSFLLSAAWQGSSVFSISILSVVKDGETIVMRKRGRIEIKDGVTVQYKVYLGRFV